ncbi:MAG: sigma-70 family RNA polymerase sigma factor [Verrucomicrobiota bacterium]|jgi:RNA polymerase sigma factor (sigma-70 family)
MTNDDLELVRQYAVNQSESVFATLVARHVNLVYSATLRQAASPQLAEEITQTVFIILARKAGSLNSRTILPGWLYRTTRFAAGAALKREARRQRREQEACMQSTLDDHPLDAVWQELSPLLDEAMAQLRDQDRDALVLRFFENKSLREVGAALGLQERAAQKRVARGLEKLHTFFARRGIASTTAIIAGAVSANSVQAAPVALAKTITAVAVAKGAAASGSTLTLIQGALKIMAWTKAKTAIVVGVAAILAAGTATVVIERAKQPHEPMYQGKLLSVWLKGYDTSNIEELFKNNGAKLHELDKIVSQFGTNAIPTLLQLLREEDFKGHNKDSNGGEASNGFRVLGASAKDAIPALIKIYEQNPAARIDIIYSLGCIGPAADVSVPWLLQRLTDTNGEERSWIVEALGQIHTQSALVVPMLINCLDDSNSKVRGKAAVALGEYGTDAKPAVSALIDLLNDKRKGIRNCASFAIKMIDPEVAVKAGLK